MLGKHVPSPSAGLNLRSRGWNPTVQGFRSLLGSWTWTPRTWWSCLSWWWRCRSHTVPTGCLHEAWCEYQDSVQAQQEACGPWAAPSLGSLANNFRPVLYTFYRFRQFLQGIDPHGSQPGKPLWPFAMMAMWPAQMLPRFGIFPIIHLSISLITKCLIYQSPSSPSGVIRSLQIRSLTAYLTTAQNTQVETPLWTRTTNWKLPVKRTMAQSNN